MFGVNVCAHEPRAAYDFQEDDLTLIAMPKVYAVASLTSYNDIDSV